MASGAYRMYGLVVLALWLALSPLDCAREYRACVCRWTDGIGWECEGWERK